MSRALQRHLGIKAVDHEESGQLWLLGPATIGPRAPLGDRWDACIRGMTRWAIKVRAAEPDPHAGDPAQQFTQERGAQLSQPARGCNACGETVEGCWDQLKDLSGAPLSGSLWERLDHAEEGWRRERWIRCLAGTSSPERPDRRR